MTIESTKQGECPESYPYAYWDDGRFCCATNLDNKGDHISLSSRSCENNDKILCPDTKCKNHEGMIKSLLEYY